MVQKLYLEQLIGKAVTKTDITTSTTIGIRKTKDEPSNEKMEITLQLFLEDYLLNIYDPITIIPANKELLDFISLKVIAVSETKEEAELIFDNGYKVIINMREEVYFGPEAMCLYGPDDFCAVWN